MTIVQFITLVGVLIGGGGLGALLQTKYANRRTTAETNKLKAETEVELGTGWKELVLTLRKEGNELRERVALLEHRERLCQDELQDLKAEQSQSIANVERRVMDLLDTEILRRKSGD